MPALRETVSSKYAGCPTEAEATDVARPGGDAVMIQRYCGRKLMLTWSAAQTEARGQEKREGRAMKVERCERCNWWHVEREKPVTRSWRAWLGLV